MYGTRFKQWLYYSPFRPTPTTFTTTKRYAAALLVAFASYYL
jgi:hypothetical protein